MSLDSATLLKGAMLLGSAILLVDSAMLLGNHTIDRGEGR